MIKLLLLPHCLIPKQKKELTNFAKSLNYKVYVVNGSQEAIKKVKENNPNILVAIACKKEISLGLKELKGKNIKIYTIDIETIEPCRKTKANLEKVKQILTKKWMSI